MKSLGNFPDPFIAEIVGQSDAIRRAASGLAAQLPIIEDLVDVAPGRQVIFTGMGSSYDACYPAVTALAGAGIAAIHVDAAEMLHFRRALLTPSTLLVAVSQSGESAEVVRLVEQVDRAVGTVVLAVTNGLENTVAGSSTLALDTRAGEELGPSTMTFAGSLVVLAAVGRVLRGQAPPRAVERLAGSAEEAAATIERLLDRDTLPDELVARLDGHGATVIPGRGPARAAAEMGALTLKEAVGLPVESLQTAQFRHGPLELAGPDLAAIVIATEPQTRDLDLALAGELIGSGASVLVVSEDGAGPAEALRVAVGPLDRSLAPAVSILPAQLLAWRLAVARGRDPGGYIRASKVTTRE